MTRYEVAIIGAGPAGMAAAIETARAGLSTVVLDEQPRPGGQIYRAVEQADEGRLQILGNEYREGIELVKSFRGCGAAYLPGASVWHVDRALGLHYSLASHSSHISAGALIIASGAIERPTPLPGWTLPGVMTAGACQILLKAHGLAYDHTVFVGSGPLIWLIASQMVIAGRKPAAIVETVSPSRYLAAIRHLSPSARAMTYLRKGVTMMRAVSSAGVPVYRGATEIEIVGDGKAEAVSFRAGGRERRVEADLVALHQGVVPNQQITRLLRCDHAWSDSQRCFTPTLDAFGETSVANVFVAGDGGGIGGATVAAMQGRLAGLRLAAKAGKSSGMRAVELLSSIKRESAIRPFLESLYAPSASIRAPADSTIICRCEEITAGQVREAVDLSMAGPNQVKSFLRNGMGPCQGRMCGLAVTDIVAQRTGRSENAVGYYRVRPPLKPIPLPELAAFTEAVSEMPPSNPSEAA